MTLLILIWSTTIYVWLLQVPRLTESVSLLAATNAMEKLKFGVASISQLSLLLFNYLFYF